MILMLTPPRSTPPPWWLPRCSSWWCHSSMGLYPVQDFCSCAECPVRVWWLGRSLLGIDGSNPVFLYFHEMYNLHCSHLFLFHHWHKLQAYTSEQVHSQPFTSFTFFTWFTSSNLNPYEPWAGMCGPKGRHTVHSGPVCRRGYSGISSSSNYSLQLYSFTASTLYK